MSPHRVSVRTSITHPLRVDWIPGLGTGRLGLTFAPGKKGASREGFRWERDVDADLGALMEAGGSTLVSLLTDGELPANGIADLYDRARGRGLEVIRFPIRDLSVPRDLDALHTLLDQIGERLSSGGGVVIHCLGGLGRTGTVAGCYLVDKGMHADEALRLLAEVRRSRECPQTHEQREFVRCFSPRSTRETSAPPTAEGVIPRWNRAPGAAPDYMAVLSELGIGGPVDQATNAAARSRSDVTKAIADVERVVRQSKGACFSFGPTGNAALAVADRKFAAGRFETPSLGSLRSRIAGRPRSAPGRVRVSALHGVHALTDIGTLQATAAPGTLFQVASQFNCLEAPSARIVAVSAYTGDNTQGPRASVSAFPATLLRHYQAPAADGSRFEQTDQRHLNLLADVFGAEVADVRSGYLQMQRVRRPAELVAALTERFDLVRVGVHDDVEVVFGQDWGGPVPLGSRQRIAQVFTSTIALGGYSGGNSDSASLAACRQLLRAAYLGTLLAALDLGKRRVVLTLIGGGVFGNPLAEIWHAISWAVSEVEPLADGTLDVIVNARGDLSDTARAMVRASGGAIVQFAPRGIVSEP